MATIHNLRRKPTLALRHRKAALLRQLHPPPNGLRASFVTRFGTCGHPNCACRQGHKHGPFYYLTQCLAAGHIVKFLLKTPAQQDRARHGIAAYHQFQDALEELSQINTELLRRGEALGGLPT
jgi:hypothetical protein